VVGGVAMEEDVAALPENIGVNGQVWTGRAIGFQSRNKAAVAVVVALNEVEIAAGIAADKVVDPANGVADGFVGRWKRGPAEIENITAQNKRTGLRGRGVNCWLVPRRL